MLDGAPAGRERDSLCADLVRTAEAYAAESTAKAYRELLPAMPARVITSYSIHYTKLYDL